jgi:hypothetical protein
LAAADRLKSKRLDLHTKITRELRRPFRRWIGWLAKSRSLVTRFGLTVKGRGGDFKSQHGSAPVGSGRALAPTLG